MSAFGNLGEIEINLFWKGVFILQSTIDIQKVPYLNKILSWGIKTIEFLNAKTFQITNLKYINKFRTTTDSLSFF